MDDAEQLRHYAQSTVSKHNSLDDALGKARAKSRYWERKAKEGTEGAVGAEKERGEAKEEAQIARLTTDEKARVEDDLARVRDALVVAEEAKRKAEAKTARLEVEWTSLLLELGAVKDEVSSFQSQVGKDKEALEEDYQKALKVIFAYGYGCCMFKHNICGSQPKVPDDVPDSSNPLPLVFFANPRCLSVPTVIEAAAVKVDLIKLAKDLEENAFVGDHS